ncbi:hypothetical protein Tco_0152715 [Tanacetum coccineum]
MMNELVRNQCDVTNHQVNVQFLLQLQPEWQRFVTLVKQSQELKTISYHKLYDILKQHQNEVNEIRDERLERTANPLTLVAQQQPLYHPQNYPTHNNQYSSSRSQQSTRNREKAIVNSSAPIYDQEPATVTEDDKMSKEKEINKLMALISLSFNKIYKPTNNNLRTSSNTSRANQDNSSRINRGTGYDNQRVVNVAGAKENVARSLIVNSMIFGIKAGVQLNAEQADWKDDTDDESEEQELEAHYMYMAQIQEVTPDPVDNSGPIFDDEPMHKDQDFIRNGLEMLLLEELRERSTRSNDFLECSELTRGGGPGNLNYTMNLNTSVKTIGETPSGTILVGVDFITETNLIENITYDGKFLQPTNDPLALCRMPPFSRSSSTKNLIESLSNSLALLTQSYKSHLPQTNNQLRTSSNARNKATFKTAELLFKMSVEDTMRTIKETYFRETMQRGKVVAGTVEVRTEEAVIILDQPNPLSATNCIGLVLDEEQSLFLAGEQIINFDEDVDNSPENDLALNMDHIFEANECDAFDSDVDEGPHHTDPLFMTNFTSKIKSTIKPGHHNDPNYSFPEIFWSIDDNNRKKAETSVPKPILALTVYPPNTPVKLVPRILPTKSQVKINLYVLTQLFTEFDKTCKTRITPTGVTEGERGFKQTKRCYLTKVIPFFKTLKEHFVGVQTSLFKEVKEMEEIFDQMNNEVDKNTVDKQCAEIEKKNLLIENENLIVNCLSTQLLYDVKNQLLTRS